ncbi:MAG: M28 family peptidase [Acidimicrobiia bacterium]|nr:M28 family peptidase [Acidimicrobiia bacterium]
MRRLAIVAIVAVVSACTPLRVHVTVLASDTFGGRNNTTQGSAESQHYIIQQLKSFGATGTNTAATGDGAFKQSFTDGTNIVGVIPGTELPNEYVIVGGHYDHLGSTCRGSGADDSICNGATDNATGAAATIEVGRAISAIPGGPRRSVIIALWDREEDGLLGSAYYVAHPLVPNNQTIAYVNFDIQGANLLPSLRNSSFAVGSETGGARLTNAVQSAIGTKLGTKLVSSIFGQGRSDYVNFTSVAIPNVFFSDSTGPCYHTVKDETAIVDWGKLDKQVAIATALTKDLIAGTAPTFVANPPLATYADAVALGGVVDQAIIDIGRFTPAQQTQLQQFHDDVNAVVAAGPAQFDDSDIGPLLSGAAGAVNLLTSGTCDGFLSQ